MVFSEVVDQRLSDPGGSENRMISDMQVINFLTREFKWMSGGEKSRGDEAGKQWLPVFSTVTDNLARQRSCTGWKPVLLSFSHHCNQQQIFGAAGCN
jgi:hypothetical protein